MQSNKPSIQQKSPSKARAVAAVLLAALAFAVACVASPTSAQAKEQIYAYCLDAFGNRTNFTNISDALTVGYQGRTIIMDSDWEVSIPIDIADSQSITINMNGHKIDGEGATTVFLLNENSSLTLTAPTFKQSAIEYRPYDNEGDRTGYTSTITIGGLVTNGYSSDGGGVRMNNNSTLTLYNVAIAGNWGDIAGGIYAKKNCTINMNWNSRVSNNRGQTGGIFFNQDNDKLTMDSATISQNYGSDKGGGICVDANYATIVMNNGSTISENRGKAGGGIQFAGSCFTLTSDNNDRTSSTIKNNITSYFAGGIHVAEKLYGSNWGTIEGITISDNVGGQGAGICLLQSNISINRCNITGNTGSSRGAGVEVARDNCAIRDCTITDNTTTGTYEACGVHVSADDDLTLSGTVIIRNNKGSDGQERGIYLEFNRRAALTTRAYIMGGVDAGSSVGIYVADGVIDRQVGKKITTYTYGTYFSDVADSCITYGEDGTLWCVSGAEGYLARVNGVGETRYKKGATITADGASTDSSKHFWYWNAETSTGLSPVTDFITDENKYDQVLTYTMPGNDTDFKAEYVDYVKSATLSCYMPEVGQSLATTGTFERTDGAGTTSKVKVGITWYVVDADGNKTPASGNAQPGKRYVAVATVGESKEEGRFFSADAISADKVSVHAIGGGDATAASTSVDASTGTLSIECAASETAKATIASVDDASIGVQAGATKAEVAAMLPTAANVKDNYGRSFVIGIDTSEASLTWPEGMFDADGKVVAPAAGESGYTMSVKLQDSDDVDNPDGKTLTLAIEVAEEEAPVQPTVTPIASTYSSATEPKLGDDQTLKVSAACETEGAAIKYSVDGGEAAAYDASTGIVLKGAANAKAEVKLEVWAESAGGKKSSVYAGTYVLDDTLGKSIEVNCSDTALYAEGAERWSASFTVTGDLGSSATAVAPDQAGRVFDHWAWAGAPEGTDLSSKTLTIANFSADLTGQITAVYTPVISVIDLGADDPVAHTALAATTNYVKVGVGDEAASTDISSYLEGYVSGSGCSITWTPDDRLSDGTAAHVTAYAASLSLKASTSAEGVKYLLADDVKLLYNGNDVHGGAYIVTAADGSRSLRVDFPSTGPYEAVSVDELAEVEVTHEAAAAGELGLPKDAVVRFACGEESYVNIEWEKASGFDPDEYGEQEIVVTGKLAFSDKVDNEKVGSEVSVKVKVAAAESVAAPTASVASGTYDAPQSVALSCETDGATIFYTLDGTEPTEDSIEYEGDPIAVADDATLKAVAVKYGLAPSAVATYDYEISVKTVEAPTATPAPGVYDAPQSVALSCATEGATIYYTTDGSEPDLGSARYDGNPVQVSGTATVKAIAAKDGMNASRVAAFTYVIETYHTVSFDSAGGTAVESERIIDGGCAKRPDDPVLDGFEFGGWLDADGNAYDFTKPVTADITLRASWSKKGEPVGRVQMFRLYNPYTGEHLYTSSEVEKAARVADGWNDEGKAWVAPSTGTEVHRLYNPYAPGGDHFYTTSAAEVEMLKAAGWSYEGVAWYSADEKTGVPVYRAYNPYAATGTHHYTVNAGEIESLVAAGWSAEGTAWYGLN